jgi:phage terminase large subunit-like protein
LNRKLAGEDAAFDIARWDELASDRVPPAGALITIGVDGARNRDALAVVACEVESGHMWPLGVWERPESADDGYEHPRGEVDEVVRDAFKRFEVWRMYIDPQYIEAHADAWSGRFGRERVISWYTARVRQTAHAVRRLTAAVAAGDLSHNGDEVLRRHVRNARRWQTNIRDEEGRPMHVIGKDRTNSPRKMDAAMAAMLAWEARGDAVAAGANGRRRSRTLVAW